MRSNMGDLIYPLRQAGLEVRGLCYAPKARSEPSFASKGLIPDPVQGCEPGHGLERVASYNGSSGPHCQVDMSAAM